MRRIVTALPRWLEGLFSTHHQENECWKHAHAGQLNEVRGPNLARGPGFAGRCIKPSEQIYSDRDMVDLRVPRRSCTTGYEGLQNHYPIQERGREELL